MTSCSLDVADRGPSTLDEISSMLNLTRERIRQIADGAIRKLKHSIKLFTLYYEKDHD
jgi:DNA-directed RNA polymerase sigma subunit (sigma70/sigma32)